MSTINLSKKPKINLSKGQTICLTKTGESSSEKLNKVFFGASWKGKRSVDLDASLICYDANFNRVKVKSPEYVKAHFIRNNNVVTDEKLIEIILEHEIDEFLIYAKDFKERLLYLKELKEKCINEIEKNIVKLNPNEFSSRKELAQEVNTNYPQFMRSFLFNYNKGMEKYNNLNASKWVDLLEKYKEWKGVKENE